MALSKNFFHFARIEIDLGKFISRPNRVTAFISVASVSVASNVREVILIAYFPYLLEWLIENYYSNSE